MTDFKARPTVYKGIKMRSRLEAGFAAWLDQWHFDWEYEPQAFGSTAGQYLPDFVCHGVSCSWLADRVDLYIEVKPANWPPPDAQGEFDLGEYERLLRSMGVIWESVPEAQLMLMQPDPRLALEDATGYRYVGAAVLDLEISPPGPNPIPWPTPVFWTVLPNHKLGLGRLLTERFRPWPDGYWKVRP